MPRRLFVVEKFTVVVDRVGSWWTVTERPRQSAIGGDGGAGVSVGDELVVAWEAEVQLVGVGGPVGMPVRCVVHFAVVTPYGAVGPGATLVSRVADDALVRGGDACAAPQVH